MSPLMILLDLCEVAIFIDGLDIRTLARLTTQAGVPAILSFDLVPRILPWSPYYPCAG